MVSCGIGSGTASFPLCYVNYVTDLPCPFCAPPLWYLASVSGSPPTVLLLSFTTKNSAHCCLTSGPSFGLPGYASLSPGCLAGHPSVQRVEFANRLQRDNQSTSCTKQHHWIQYMSAHILRNACARGTLRARTEHTTVPARPQLSFGFCCHGSLSS